MVQYNIWKGYNYEICSYGYDKLVDYLKDHIAQFDKYIKSSDKDVAVFIVIAPDFTQQSIQECVDYSLNNDTQILLITADELKQVAETWAQKHSGEIFNLGYFKQNGRFDISLLKI